MDTPDNTSFWRQARIYLRGKFNLEDDKATQDEVQENISKGVEFKGTNLWILIFAILVASVGLNVNSTAVIIGAMLISPLMGPIMGIRLSLGINDFDLLKRSFRNFLLAVAISILTSTVYFLISPLSIAQSELLARTSPTIWDVLIATFGGLAGIIAQTRKDRTSTVIPGVAIATALMPPLCTAGYGLASGKLEYFAGAFYLFFINAVFIAFSTFFVVHFLHYQRVKLLDQKRAKRVKQYIAAIIIVTLVPSVFMAYTMVQKAVWDNNSRIFVEKSFDFPQCQVVNTVYDYDPAKGSTINVMLMGEPLSEDIITSLGNSLPQYRLHKTRLVVRQASEEDKLDNATMQNILMSNVEIIAEKNSRIAQLEKEVARNRQDTLPTGEMSREIAALWGNIGSFAVNKAYVNDMNGVPTDTLLLCLIRTTDGKPLGKDDNRKLADWLRVRTDIDNVKIIEAD